MKTLLAIIKDPNGSKQFIKYTADMAVDYDYSLHILYMLNPADYPLGVPYATGGANLHVQEDLSKMVDSAKKTLLQYIIDTRSKINEDIDIELTTEVGVVEHFAAKLLVEKKINSIIIERNENENIWNQSYFSKEIIKKMNCPVWVIPYKANYYKYGKIIYATDYNEEDVSTIRKLVSLMQPLSPEITAVHITDNYDFIEKVKKSGYTDMLKKNTNYKNIDIKVLNEINEKSTKAELLNSFASLIGANVIVVLRENRGFLEKIFKSSGTTAKELVNISQLPVLVFHGN